MEKEKKKDQKKLWFYPSSPHFVCVCEKPISSDGSFNFVLLKNLFFQGSNIEFVANRMVEEEKLQAFPNLSASKTLSEALKLVLPCIEKKPKKGGFRGVHLAPTKR